MANLYKFVKTGGVLRLADTAFIPQDTKNIDWLDYLKYVAQGGQTDPAQTSAEIAAETASATEVAAREANRQAMLADTLVSQLANSTPAQIDAYVVANLNDLPSAKSIVRALAQVCGVFARSMK